MPVFYWEPSAQLKRYRAEIGTDFVYEAFDGRRPDEVFCTSYLTDVELTSVLTRFLRGNVLTETTYRQMRGLLREDLTSRMAVSSVTDDILVKAVDLAATFALRGADAVQLASALDLRIRSRTMAFILVCADGRINEAALARGLEIMNPEHQASLLKIRQSRL